MIKSIYILLIVLALLFIYLYIPSTGPGKLSDRYIKGKINYIGPKICSIGY